MTKGASPSAELFEGTLHEGLKETSLSEGFKGTSPLEGGASLGLGMCKVCTEAIHCIAL